MPDDRLATMMKLQESFQKRFNPSFPDMPTEAKVDFIMKHSIYLEQEIQEALYELPFFKSWKDYSKMTEAEIAEAFDKYRKEMIDAWHFFMNMLLAAGMTADDLFDEYIEKNLENIRRQEVGYDYKTFYREDHQ